MTKFDIERIKQLTNEKIVLTNIEREEIMRHKKMKICVLSLIGIAIIVGGALAADALTDSSISNAIKENIITKLKINGKDYDYNSKCQKLEDGTIKCTLGKEVTEDSEEVSVETYIDIDEKNLNSLEGKETKLIIESE